MKYLLIVCVILSILSFSYAGTVTLTGTCTQSLIGNTITFNLNNSGDQAAYSVSILPSITNATINNTNFSELVLNPKNNYKIKLLLSNITGNGTYVNYFKVSYQQSNSTFYAIFPCINNFYTDTNSNISLNTNITEKNNIYYINVTVFNKGSSEKIINVSLMLPDSFSYISSSYNITSIKSNQSKNITFVVKGQPGIGSYSGGVSATYVSDGLHYSSYSTLILLQNQNTISVQPVFNISPIFIAIGVVLFVLLILIIRAFLKSRKKLIK